MVQHTGYEKGHSYQQQTAFGIALGRITAVYPDERMVEVKTFHGHGVLSDQHIPKCQWLSMDSNPDGDETTTIPRVNSTCLVFFVSGEPFVFGFFKALNKDGAAITGKEVPGFTEGDKILSTVGGNRVAVKSSGVIEVFSKESLRTIYFPKDSLLLHLCRNFEHRADGGNITWKTDTTDFTLWQQEFRKDLARSFVIIEQKGNVGATTISRTVMGVGVPGVNDVPLPIYEHTMDITGKTVFSIQPPGIPIGFTATIQPTGAFNIKAGAVPQFSFDVAVSGETKLTVNSIASLSISASGEISAKNPTGEITMSVAGEVTVKCLNKATIDAKAGVDIKAIGPVNVQTVGPVKIKGTTVQLDGGTGASDFVLTFPTTLSPFTGAPLTPFSTTVMVSK